MNSAADYLIYAVHYHPQDKDHIEKVKAFFHYHPEDRDHSTREMTKEQLVDCIQSGSVCRTALKKDGHHHAGKEIFAANIFGREYVKIHKDADTRDYLGELPEY